MGFTPQESTMSSLKQIAVGMGLAAALATSAAAQVAPRNNVTPAEKREIRRDVREVRQDRREVKQDRRELRRDIKQGDNGDIRGDRRELMQDRREVRQDKRELKRDVRQAKKP